MQITLREKCPNTEFFLVRTFLYSVGIQGHTDQKKLGIWTLFTQCYLHSHSFHGVIFYVINSLFSFKPLKVPEGVMFFAFAIFCVTCMQLWTVKRLCSIFFIILSNDVNTN